MEYREFRAEPVGVNDDGKLHGSALPFNRKTVIGDLKRGGWREEAAPGLTQKSINDGDILFLAHHDMHMPLARTSAGNLSLREESDHLHWEADPVDTSYGRDIRALADAKVLGGVSIGFNAVKDEWRDDAGNPSDKFNGTHRILREIKLIEISAVTKPAYKDTSIMARDELLAEREALAERAASINTAGRKKLASKGHALPDGSYPIPDVSHLHAAAVLAASHHGNWQAAKALIRRRAKALGVDVNTLPGFGKKSGSRSEDAVPETRIKKSTAKRVVQIHVELHQAMDKLKDVDVDELPAGVREAIAFLSSASVHTGHIIDKEKLSANDLTRAGQEPDTSTPDGEDDDVLNRAFAQAQDSHEIGFG